MTSQRGCSFLCTAAQVQARLANGEVKMKCLSPVVAGTRGYVRETWQLVRGKQVPRGYGPDWDEIVVAKVGAAHNPDLAGGWGLVYRAGSDDTLQGIGWRSGAVMPGWAARLVVEVAEVVSLTKGCQVKLCWVGE